MRCLGTTSTLLLLLLSILTRAQECDFQSPYVSSSSPVTSPDLPDFIAADITLPAGSLIIPMDNSKQIYNPGGADASSVVPYVKTTFFSIMAPLNTNNLLFLH